MTNTIGVIDVGTNSVLALGLTRRGEIVFNDYNISEFGKGLVNNNHRLSADAIERTLGIVGSFVAALQNCGIEAIKITGTSASRDAENIGEFADAIHAQHGITYEVISGADEAMFTYLGALSLFRELPKHNLIMMDIGGGSTEVIFGNGKIMNYKKSFQMGSVRLKDQLRLPYQFSESDTAACAAHISGMFSALPPLPEAAQFIGIGGTFTTIAAIDLKLSGYDPTQINGHALSLARLEEIFTELNQQNETERSRVIGLEAKRAPLILYGLLIFITFMKETSVSSVTTTDYGLRFGVANKYFLEH